jgi:pimeloyl-ACP methyl ester carboxylesterase
VARDVRGAVIPASGHNIALENPAALAQAYLDFFHDSPSRVVGQALDL